MKAIPYRPKLRVSMNLEIKKIMSRLVPVEKKREATEKKEVEKILFII